MKKKVIKLGSKKLKVTKNKKLTSTKAKKILADGMVRGHKLSMKQKKFFGAMAGGAKMKKKHIA